MLNLKDKLKISSLEATTNLSKLYQFMFPTLSSFFLEISEIIFNYFNSSFDDPVLILAIATGYFSKFVLSCNHVIT